jgi:hypothetical protein
MLAGLKGVFTFQEINFLNVYYLIEMPINNYLVTRRMKMITRRRILKYGSMLGIGTLMSHWFDFSRLAIGAVPQADPSILSDGIMVADFSGTKWQAIYFIKRNVI